MKKYCPHESLVPILDRTNYSMQYKKQKHIIGDNGVIECSQYQTQWCCTECCVEEDMMDLKTFKRVTESKDKTIRQIICCKCSGNKPSWA